MCTTDTKELCEKSEKNLDYSEYVSNVFDELKELWKTKNRSYGNSIQQPCIFCPSLPPKILILTRMSDKVKRITTLLNNPHINCNGESLIDTMADLAVYTINYIAMSRYDIDRQNQQERDDDEF